MGSPYVTFPGTSGRYAARADVNLFDADTAHLHQSIGQWINLNESYSLGLSTALSPYIGDFHGTATLNGNGSAIVGIRTPATGEPNPFPVTAGVEYSFTVRVASSRNANSARISLYWWDNTSYGQIGPQLMGAVTVLSDTDWTELTYTATAPTGAVAVSVAIDISGCTWTANDLLYWDAAGYRTGATATFIPSMDVVGTLDETIEPAGMAVDYVKGQDLRIGEDWAGDAVLYERRDGVGGPLVAVFDAADVLEAVA